MTKNSGSKEGMPHPSSKSSFYSIQDMTSLFEQISEAEDLLEEIDSWSEEEIEELPKFYSEKAREYQGLLQQGEE